jgi:phosphoenolpyruvate-protein kinase (PTS system EI component)
MRFEPFRLTRQYSYDLPEIKISNPTPLYAMSKTQVLINGYNGDLVENLAAQILEKLNEDVERHNQQEKAKEKTKENESITRPGVDGGAPGMTSRNL